MKPGVRKWLPFIAAAVLGFGLSFGLVAALLFPSGEAVQEVRVPSVTGLPYSDAERRLKSIGLRVTLGAQRESADMPPNAVVSQQPVAGEIVLAGTEIVLDISQGQGKSTVPAVVGASREDAQQQLRDAGLASGDVRVEASDTVARGIVLSSSPSAGAAVPPGTRVSLVVSGGPPKLSLPDVVGRDVSLARGTLEQLGLSAVVEYDSLSGQPAGTVVSQSPAAGAQISPGTSVTLRVSGKP